MAKWNHFISLLDYEAGEVRALIDRAREVKAHPEAFRTALSGKTLGMVFEKSSTRTRVSFEVGMVQLGGYPLFLSKNDLQIGRGEPIEDTARVLSRFLDVIMARTFSHQTILDLATYGTIPVVNGLSDLLHPCQALADYMTVLEHKGTLAGLTLCYVGDGNNVAHSLMNGGARLGVNVTVACPPSYEPDPAIVAAAQDAAKETRATIRVLHDPRAAMRGADVVYTDVWASMGQEAEATARKVVFAPYQVNEELFALADSEALFLHCLPAHRGEEVTAGVIDHPRSVIFDEAENRLHAQKAVLLALFGR